MTLLGPGGAPVDGGGPGASRAPGLLHRLGPYLPSVPGWQRTTRGQLTLVRARASADRVMLVTFALLVLVAAVLASAIPRQLSRTVDGGARQAVTAGGPDAAADVHYVARYVAPERGFGRTDPVGIGDATTAAEMRERARAVVDATPADVKAILGPMTVLARSGPLTVHSLYDQGAKGLRARAGTRMMARVGWADPAAGGAVTYVRGTPPTSTWTSALHRPVIPVGVAEDSARTWHLDPGARLVVTQSGSGQSVLVVTGIYRADEPSASVWQVLDSAQGPITRDPERTGATVDEITFLVDESALPVAQAGLGDAGLVVHLRRPVDVERLTGSGLREAADTLDRYARDELDPLPADPSAEFTGTLPEVADTYVVRARAVVAELSVAVVSVVGVAGVVLLLAAQLLIRRRRRDLALQHARGASLTSIFVGLALESAAVAVPVCLIGLGIGVLLTPGGKGDARVFALVPAVAVLLAPLLGVGEARAAWASRRTPANRRARARQAADVGGRRVVGELVVVAAAVAAVVSLRTRGLTDNGDGVDPLLAAAPLLLTAAVTVVVLRIYPWPVRLIAALARRGRSALPVVAAARARAGLSWSPLLALTLAVGLMVGTGLIRTTLDEGQERASWERVGADVRVDLSDSFPVNSDVAALRAAPGVEAVCTGGMADARATIGTDNVRLRALIVDSRCYAGVLRASGLEGIAALDLLTTGSGGVLPVLVSGEDPWTAPAVLRVGDSRSVPVRQVGTPPAAAVGWLNGPVVVIDTAAAREADIAVTPTTLWLSGPGSAAAVAAQPRYPAWDVVDRAVWREDLAGAGVIADMGRLLIVALVVLALLAAIAMAQTVAAGAGERGQAVSLLRTLGLTVREGRLLTLAELIPLVIAGVAGGALAGTGLVRLLGPSLGMQDVTGGVTAPPLRMSPTWAASVLGAALVVVVVAAAVESVTQRMQRLASVLRVGDTR